MSKQTPKRSPKRKPSPKAVANMIAGMAPKPEASPKPADFIAAHINELAKVTATLPPEKLEEAVTTLNRAIERRRAGSEPQVVKRWIESLKPDRVQPERWPIAVCLSDVIGCGVYDVRTMAVTRDELKRLHATLLDALRDFPELANPD